MYDVGSGAAPAALGEQLARSLLAEGPPLDLSAPAAAQYVERCQDALSTLGGVESITAVRLLTAIAIASAHVSDSQGNAPAEVVAAMADRLGDDVSRAHALLAWCMTHQTPEHAEERVRTATAVLDIAASHGDVFLLRAGYLILLVALLETGEVRTLDTELLMARAASAGLATVQGGLAQRFECLRSILDGDAEGAEHLADALLATAPPAGTDALALHTTQIGMIRWMQGRIDGVEEMFLTARRHYPEQLLWPASLAWLWLRQGRRGAAEALLRTLPAADALPQDRYWLSTLTVLAEIAILHGNRDDAQQVRDHLHPHADRLVPVGVGVAFWGTAARTLGLLEERLGMLDEARAHLELAVDNSSRIGALAWQAEAQIELAEFALRHNLTDVPVHDLLAEARATSIARGFPALAHRALAKPRIRVLGRFEVVALNGVLARWTSRKARELLKMLVAARGVSTSREVFMDVLWPGEVPEKLGNRFSVAITVIRRALDPERLLPTQHHVVTEGDSVRLDLDRVDVDLERFVTLASARDETSRQAARDLYLGDAFSDEPYADWSVRVRSLAQRLHRELG